ncbi:MAG: SurA N-terminal domain-containing protein, partial [Candidatus Margulisiibacteriota bacterium]
MNWIRRHAATLIWIALIAFVVTLAAGTLSDQFFSKSPTAPQNPETAIAWVGTLPVNAEKYQETLLAMINQFQQRYPQSSIPPEWYEMMQYNALQESVQYTVLLNAAEKANVRVSGSQLQSAMDAIYAQYHLKDNAALREFLKKNQYPYDKFEAQLRNDLMVQTFLQNLQNSVTVTDRDMANKYTQINASHILIRPTSPTENPQAAHDRAAAVYKKILAGMSFEKAAQHYSEDPGSKGRNGNLGWVR